MQNSFFVNVFVGGFCIFNCMLKILSYLNITLALTYFFGYLLNSYSWPIAAILLVIVFNGLVLRNVENNRNFTAVHYTLAVFNVVFAGFLSIWVVNILRSSIEHNYFGDSRIYLFIASLFVVSIILHVALVVLTKRNHSDEY